MDFINLELRNNIQYVLKEMFPNMNSDDILFLNNCMIGLINIVNLCHFREDDYDVQEYRIKLLQNNNRNLKWLLISILPYINTSIKGYEDIVNLSDLYSVKREDSRTIDKYEPKYIFTNIQYSRHQVNPIREIPFDRNHILENLYLFFESIRLSRNKLYVNWIDIIPIKNNNMRNSKLYKELEEIIREKKFVKSNLDSYTIDKFEDSTEITKINEQLKGINIDDIYDILSNDLYENVINYKFFIFDIHIVHEGKDKLFPLLFILSHIYDISYAFEDKYSEIDISKKNDFEKILADLINYAESGNNYSIIDGYIPNESIKVILKSIVLFFDRKYRNNKLSGYYGLRNIRENVDDYDESLKGIGIKDIIKTAKSITPRIFKDYMIDSVKGFYNTYYCQFISKIDRRTGKINRDLNNFTFDNNKKDDFPIGIFTLKNLYNFAKSLVHIKIKSGSFNFYSESYQRLPRYWRSLSEQNKQIILDRLNRVKTDWYAIPINIYRVRNNLKFSTPITRGEVRIYEFNSWLFDVSFDIMHENIIFHLIKKGVLTKLIPRNEYTDKSVYDMSNNEMKSKFVKNVTTDIESYSDCYYYLTSESYSKKYFDIISNPDTSYITFFAFEWMAQINFIHKFLNNRVSFITASTGAGKSTQIPKLYLYNLLAFDYNYGATVLLTAPRTNAVKGLVGRVSIEMAVDYTEGYQYVQFKYSGNNNVRNGNFLKIRYVTDGSVINDMNDPLMIPRYQRKGKYFYGKEQKNKYDIIMVDEAHEHNPNMDLILSMAKTTVHVNNSIRLSIVSATIDDDEPNYRRFYRDIDDNRKYPLDIGLNQDRINVDRRLHLSPPDQSTRFKIYEQYRPKDSLLDLVREIITKDQGDVLIFETGKKSINDLVLLINQNTPDNVIAIPYYADLSKINKEYEELIKNIDKKKNAIRFTKKDFEDFDYDQLLDKIELGTTKTSIYDRVIIVSTNVAEASVTINGLKYVIETGREKIGFFDYEREASVIKENFITDASRLQRRGRVGRKSEGYVYYNYEEGFLLGNRKKFNIAIQDLSNTFISLLSNKSDEKIISKDMLDIIIGKKEITLDINDSIMFFIRSHYYVYDNGFKFFDKKSDEINLERVERNFINVYFSGYDKDTLIDKLGIFYIIHPEELNIERNIYRDVIKSLDDNAVIVKDNQIISQKIGVFWKILIDSLMIGIENGRFYKTEYADYVLFLSNKLDFINMTYIKLFVWMLALSEQVDSKLYHKMISVMAFLQSIDNVNGKLLEMLMDVVKPYEIKKIEIESKYSEKELRDSMRILKEETKNKYSQSGYITGGYIIESDLDVIINYLDRYYNFDIYEKQIIDRSKDLYNVLGVRGYVNLLDEDDVKKRMEIKEEGSIFGYEKILERNFNSLAQRKVKAENEKFNEELNKNIRLIYKEIVQIKFGIYFDDFEFSFDKIRDILSGFRKFIKGKIKYNVACMILSNPRNVVRHICDSSIDRKNKYVLMRNPSLMTIGRIPYSKYFQKEDTFINESSKQRYLIFMNHNINTNEMKVLSLVRLQDLKLIMNIYNPKYMKSRLDERKLRDEKEFVQNIKSGLISPNFFDMMNAKSNLLIYPSYYNTLKKIYSELAVIYDKFDVVWKILKDLGYGYDDYLNTKY